MNEEKLITPRNNNFMIGQDAAEQIFLQAWQSGNMHHAWILSGPNGIGKATMAFRIARFLLSADAGNKMAYKNMSISEKSAVFQQIAGGSNPDLLVLERDYIEADKKKILSAIKKGEALDEEELSGLKKSAFIRVDDVRKVGDFLSKTSFNDGWRVVIIDSADDMNKNAANALLKILEEPPAKTILLLVSHNPGLLLPTIRSRCAKLPMHTLKDAEVASLLRRYRADLDEPTIAKLVEMAGGSIGKAILYADMKAFTIYEELCAILYAKQKFKLEQMLDFCTEIAADDSKFTLLEELLMKFFKDNMSFCQDVEAFYQCKCQAVHMFDDCLSVNMDKRLMLVNLLTEICQVL